MMRGSEDDIVMSGEMVGARTQQLLSAVAWLSVESHKTALLQMDTAGFLHVTAGDERAVFALDGADA